MELDSFDEEPLFYDRQGKPLDTLEWARKFEDRNYQRVAWAQVGDVAVSTVWLGIKSWPLSGPPMIFETMVFGPISLDEYQWRYPSEEAALAGHQEIVTLVKTQLDILMIGGAEEPAATSPTLDNARSESPDRR